MSNPVKSRLTELDALRGIAILMVVVFHFSMPMLTARPTLLTRFGIMGVDLFFMISGFVIFMSLKHVKSGKEFLVSRVARLYPTYWWCVSITVVLFYYRYYYSQNYPMDNMFWIRYLGNMTMFQFYLNIELLDGPYWSLIIEVVFYITMLVIYKLGRKAQTESILLSVVVFWGVVELLSAYFPNSHQLKFISGLDKYYPLFDFLPLFLIGVVFYNIWSDRLSFYRGAIIAVCFFAQILSYHRQGALSIFNVTRFDFAMLILVFIGLFIMIITGLLKKMNLSPLLFFGKISYALYLMHQFFCLYFLMPLLENKVHIPHSMSIVLSFGIAVLLAWFNTKFIDEPSRKAIKKMFYPKTN